MESNTKNMWEKNMKNKLRESIDYRGTYFKNANIYKFKNRSHMHVYIYICTHIYSDLVYNMLSCIEACIEAAM